MRPPRLPRTPRSQYRQLRRESDGSLYDIADRRAISTAEIRDDIQAGRRFRAVHHDTGADCTSQVLAESLRGALADKVGLGTGLPAGLVTLASTVLSALENREEAPVRSVHRGAPTHSTTVLPGRDELSNSRRD